MKPSALDKHRLVPLPWDRVSEVRDALVVPRQASPATRLRTKPGGVFDANGLPVPEGEVGSYRWAMLPLPELSLEHRPKAQKLSGRWLFGGIAHPHFGHVLTNGIGRIWAAERLGPFEGIVFMRHMHRANHNPILADVLTAFGLPSDHHVCTVPTIVESLVVVPDLFSERLRCRPDAAYVEWARSLRPAAPPKRERRRLYVSRRNLASDFGRILCEDILEDNLVTAGFEAFVPEDLSITEQIAAYGAASEIVCMESSALHLIALSAGAHTQVTVIRRRPDPPDILTNHIDGFLADQMVTIDAIRTMWWREVRAENRAMAELDFVQVRDALIASGGIRKTSPWRVPTAAEVLASRAKGSPEGSKFLTTEEHQVFVKQRRLQRAGVQKMQDAARPPALPPIDGIRYLRMLGRMHLALAPKWYLEVGTFTGRSLSKVDCNFVAVDPQFRLRSPLSHPNARQMHLFQQTSDDFFESKFAERNEIKFDFAFLDGLHHFEVLLRDFINAERLMSPGGVIALHDCCPSTVEMTVRDQIDGAWTGDVWKTFLILMRNRPDLTFDVASAAPTGLVVIRGLDPDSTVLSERYDALVEEYRDMALADFEGGIEGYFREFDLQTPEEVVAKL